VKHLLFLLCTIPLVLLAAGSTLLFVLFTGNLLTWPRLDAMQSLNSWPVALGINIILLLLFGLQHSIMARKPFKAMLLKWLPEGLERMFYGLASSLVLLLLIFFWQPIPIVLWDIKLEGLRIALYALFFLGWLLNLVASNSIDGAALLGVRQLKRHFYGGQTSNDPFTIPFLYKMVRHPLYLGLIIAFWSAPLMTLSHFVFSFGMTAYIFIGIHFEERSLVDRFGDTYVQYQKDTPKLFPRITHLG